MNAPLDAREFRGRGFCVVIEEPNYLKLVKQHCEIHVRKVKQGTVLEIPVMRLRDDKPPGQALLTYLLERNGAEDGAGFFAIKQNCIYYRAVTRCEASIVELALDMVDAVERLGPKVLNVARQ